jgi:hypothetical protein
MSVMSRTGVVQKAVIATLVGSAIGITAGVWSLRHTATAARTATKPTTDSDTAPSRSTSVPKQVAAVTDPTPPPSGTSIQSADDDARVLERARTLARRPDVTALMALRDDVVRRATERGVAGSQSIKREIDEIDARLNEARLLQLKLDAQELRKVNSKLSP